MAQPGEFFELVSAEVTPRGITIAVPTGGCTQKADILVTIESSHPQAVSVGFQRLGSDDCKGYFPHGLLLTYSWAELGLQSPSNVQLLNPVKK